MANATFALAEPAILATDLRRQHKDGRDVRRVLDGASLHVVPGEVVAIMGPSGSGKTTLLHLLAGLDEPDGGELRLAGVDWKTLHGKERAAFRRRTCGFILQGFGLMPQATAAENVEIPLLLDGVEPAERAQRVDEALGLVGLSDEGGKLPDQLSGGQRQRVAIARALVTHPEVLLADEPTGSLDTATAADVAQLLVRTARERATALVIVTHSHEVARLADRVLRLHDGRLESA